MFANTKEGSYFVRVGASEWMGKEFSFIHVVTKGGHDGTEKRVPGIIMCLLRELSLQKRTNTSGE